MDERKGILKKYKEYHLNEETGSIKELQQPQLFKQGIEFLCSQSVKPRDRFLYLNTDFYKSILLKIATCDSFEKREGNALNRLIVGFHSLEKYALNLWKFPWRKEYHSIKLYTAFFKYNVQEQLQDTDAILAILKSLGYRKTMKQDQVQVKEPDFRRALWVSLDLYLVQLDLLIIKEIMDALADSKLSISCFIRARSKTYDVNEACQFLSTDMAKRAKLEETQDSDASQKQLKQTPIGAINPTAGVTHGAAYAISRADSRFKNPILSTTTETTAMETDETLTGAEGIESVSSDGAYQCSRVDVIYGHVRTNINPAPFRGVLDRDLYGADAEENHVREAKQDPFVAPHKTSHQTRHLSDVTKRVVDTSMGSSHSLSYLGTTTFARQGHRHSAQDYTHSVDIQSGRVWPSTRITADTRTVHPEITSGAGWQAQGSSGSDKHAKTREIRGSASQLFASKELLETDRRKETAVEDQRRLSATEPMEVDPPTASNRIDNLNSHSKKMAGGAYATPKAQSGVSDLNNTLQYNLTLENGTSKEASARSSSAREAPSSGVGAAKVDYLRRKEHLSGREVVGVSQSNRPPMPNVGAMYDTGTRTADGRGYSSHKREENGLSDDVSQNTRVSTGTGTARFLQYQGKSNENLHEVKMKMDYYSEKAGNDHVHGAEASSLKKDERFERATSKLDTKHTPPCSHCKQQGELICKDCLLIVCKVCDGENYNTEFYGTTKGKHVFSELKSVNSLDTSFSNQQLFGPGDEGKEWACFRCTYLNSPKDRICDICGTTRGVGDVEPTKPGSTVCKYCTLHNEQDATVCKACAKILDKTETFV